ncbi:hypothetical protein [Streptomyces sp. NPDC006012]|uniref:hypothetical protein n=1 Tax=Streptomyces sp. NPDC006012 TaxID=3364739 RepID=UPI00369AFDA7
MGWQAAQWLAPCLAGMGLVSWQGGFGGQGNLGLWWDILVVAAFSPAVHYWARATASRPGEIERSIEEAAVTEAPAH